MQNKDLIIAETNEEECPKIEECPKEKSLELFIKCTVQFIDALCSVYSDPELQKYKIKLSVAIGEIATGNVEEKKVKLCKLWHESMQKYYDRCTQHDERVFRDCEEENELEVNS